MKNKHDIGIMMQSVVVREQLDPTEKVVFQAIQMALIAVLSEVQQQQKKFIKFWAKSPC